MTDQPTLTAVIATSGRRPELLRGAARSILGQDHPGGIELIVVFDHVEIDPLDADLEVPAHRSIRCVSNHHRQGLAGGRNTGVDLARGEFIGFCDDDDTWLPEKTSRQLRLWQEHPQAAAVSGGMLLRSGGTDHDVLAPERTVQADLLRARIPALSSTSTIYRREDLLPGGKIGPFDEDLPAAYGEDYDMLLRTTRHGEIRSVPEATVRILWDRPSFFSGHWQKMADGLTYVLRKFPEFEQDPKGTARIAGQVAFAQAAMGRRHEALRWIRACLRRDPRQLRAWAAIPVALGLVSGARLVRAVEKTGRGL